MKDAFDEKIKEALENFEMPYDANAWAELEQQLPSTPLAESTAAGSSSKWKIAALLGTLVVAASVWYFSNDAGEDIAGIEQTAVQPQASENTSVNSDSEIITESKVSENNANTAEASSETNSVKNTEGEQTTESIVDVDEEIMRSSETEIPKEVVGQLKTKSSEDKPQLETTPSVSNEKPVVLNFIASALTACVNEDVSFINESKVGSAKMMWDFGDGFTSVEKDPTHSFVSSGNYTVTLRATTESGVVDKKVEVRVNPVPTPMFSAERKLNGYQAIPLYEFKTATQSGERAIWSFSDDNSRISGAEATKLFRNAGKHTAKLVVTNKFGCSTTMTKDFITQKFNLLAPTAFTPGGDGINETFMPKALPEMGIPFEMTVQDPKTGQVVYRTEDAAAPWNGTLNNSGVELEKGLYVWTVVLKDNVLENRVFTETIKLKR